MDLFMICLCWIEKLRCLAPASSLRLFSLALILDKERYSSRPKEQRRTKTRNTQRNPTCIIMRILIIDYEYRKEGGLTMFMKKIRARVLGRSENLEGVDFEFQNFGSLNEYLYFQDIKKDNRVNGVRFDQVDLIFVNGPNKLRPYYRAVNQVATLFKMSFNTEKPLFCSGCAAFLFVFVLATNMEYV